MEVLSLFDGISCGHVALERAGFSADKYYASEIDKYAISIYLRHFPNHKRIDLVMGGSPCQGFSNAGKGKNFEDPRSKLFWEYVRILKEANPKYFLLENVTMKKEWENIITEALDVEPIMIDSALVSAAHRKRLYWTNIPAVSQPENLNIYFGDIREHNVPEGNIYYSEAGMEWIRRHERRTGKVLRHIQDDEKMQMLEATMYKKYSSQRFFGIDDTYGIRYITVKECERCMGLPDGYTSSVSNTQAYKQLGNGWNVDTIAHIFKGMEL